MHKALKKNEYFTWGFNIIKHQLFGDYSDAGIWLSIHLSPNNLFFFHLGYHGFGNHPTASSYYTALFSISWLFDIWPFWPMKIERLNVVSSSLYSFFIQLKRDLEINVTTKVFTLTNLVQNIIYNYLMTICLHAELNYFKVCLQKNSI